MRLTFRIAVPLALVLAAGGCDQTLDAGFTRAGEATVRATASAQVDAITMDRDHLYFTCEDGWLYRLAKTGTAPAERIARAAAPGSVYTNGIAVDDDHVYWTALGDGVSQGTVERAPKAGGAAEVLATMQARPMGIAVDGDYVYWADEAGVPPGNTGGIGEGLIERMPKDGSGPPTVLASSLVAPDFIALDDQAVYWHDTHAIARVPKVGGGSTKLFHSAISFKSSNLVVSGGQVFWAGHQGAWTLESIPTEGGSVTHLAAGIDQPSSVALFGSSLVWGEAVGPSVAEVIAMPTAGGSPTILWPANAQPAVQDDRALFLLADEHALYSVESWGDTSVTVAIRVLPM